MKIMITGGAGFLGQRLARTLLNPKNKLEFEELILVDIVEPSNPTGEQRVSCHVADLTNSEKVEAFLSKKLDIIFHLAAVVSGHAEADFDTGMKVNFDLTRTILEATRRYNPFCKIIFTSSVGVFGGVLPEEITEMTATTPKSSYGTQKAMCELLINDYSRKGFIDGRVLRLPTITVRPGTPNRAVTSFASGIIREPLQGKQSICPVSEDLKIWISSPHTVIQNIIHAAILPASAFGDYRTVNLPGITVSVQDMVEALIKISGPDIVKLIRFEPDENANRIVKSLPSSLNCQKALSMGFEVDQNIQHIIYNFVNHDLKGNLA